MRVRRAVLAVAILAGAATSISGGPAPTPVGVFPVATDDALYSLCGRVFPDPHAFWPLPAPLPLQSPWAKGNAACRAVDFLGWDETIAGLRFLESMLPGYVEIYDLSDPTGPFAPVLDLASGEGMSSGLPTEGLGRERVPLYAIRVTDEADTAVPLDDRELFAYALSIHGIERAGVEGGVRAAEDLATWAACEADASALPTCALNGPYPHPIMESLGSESISAGDALRRSQVWFVLSNPDGWRRGDKQAGGFFYQRYNGNGMDLNRDWPSSGFTFRPYTPWSEPENRTYGKVLQAVSRDWTGGIDLHGQLIDRAFSFTLIGGSERPFDKDRRVLQFVEGAWQDAEIRLAWSPIIKPNDAPPACVGLGVPPSVSPDPTCELLPRLYGVQWGTIWDTIAYTTTGALSDWMDSAIGLDADGIGNEMSLSHVSNCGVGSCYLTEFEQLHVDGNKSLIYAMIHYSLLPEDTAFRYGGDAGWLDHDVRITNPGGTQPGPSSGLPRQPGFAVDLVVTPLAPTVHEFEVLGPADGVENRGFAVTATSTNLAGVSVGSFLEFAIDRQEAGGWTEVSSYFNQSPTYFQAGARVDVNLPTPGRYRIRIEGTAAGAVHADVAFTAGLSWPDPGQVAYDVSNLEFFADLVPFAPAGALAPVPVDGLLAETASLDGLDSLVIADGAFLPGDADDEADAATLLTKLRAFVEGGGNLVLTDDALLVVEHLGLVPQGTVVPQTVYAGFVEFSLDEGTTDTYADPLAANVDRAGAAEGPGHRHQLSEPVPTGFAIQDASGADAGTMPEWGIDRTAWETAGGRVVGLANGAVTLGELPVGDGQIRIIGSLLPMPTEAYDHPFGLDDYAVTYSGYEVFRNALDVSAAPSPVPVPAPGPAPASPSRVAPAVLPATGASGSSLLVGAIAVVALALLARPLRRRARGAGASSPPGR